MGWPTPLQSCRSCIEAGLVEDPQHQVRGPELPRGFENEECLFSRTWTFDIPRDGGSLRGPAAPDIPNEMTGVPSPARPVCCLMGRPNTLPAQAHESAPRPGGLMKTLL